MTKIGRFLRVFTLADYSALAEYSLADYSAVGFFGLLKTYKTLRQKVMFLISLIFTGKAMHFYGLISKLVVLLIKEEMHCSNFQPL